LRPASDTIFAAVSTLLALPTVRETALTPYFKTREHLQGVAH
jgi:hypothetical protein